MDVWTISEWKCGSYVFYSLQWVLQFAIFSNLYLTHTKIDIDKAGTGSHTMYLAVYDKGKSESKNMYINMARMMY